MPEEAAQPAAKLPWYNDPERRAEHLRKLQEGRRRGREQRKIQPNPAPQLPAEESDGEPDYRRLIRDLNRIRWDRVDLTLGDSLLSTIDAQRSEALRRLQVRRDEQSPERCHYCKDAFLFGRHVEQLSWFDPDTMRPVGRRVCGKIECRTQLHRDFDAVRARNQR